MVDRFPETGRRFRVIFIIRGYGDLRFRVPRPPNHETNIETTRFQRFCNWF